jgi:threonine dehydrogenase-like Zn-dependent dehydrogenase
VPGTTVTVVDPNAEREVIARALGVPWRAEPPERATADLVIHASGHAEGLRSALDVAALEATVVEASWFGCHPVSLPLGEGFHSKRLTVRSSQVARIPPDRTPRWTHARRMRLALDLLRAPELDALITGESRFEDLPEVMTRLSRDARSEVCHRIRYDDV